MAKQIGYLRIEYDDSTTSVRNAAMDLENLYEGELNANDITQEITELRQFIRSTSNPYPYISVADTLKNG